MKNILAILFAAFILIACEKETVQVISSPCMPQYPYFQGGYIRGNFTGKMPDGITSYVYPFDMQYENINAPQLSEIEDDGFTTRVYMQRSNVCSDQSQLRFTLKHSISSFSFPLTLDTSNCSHYSLGVWLIRNIGDSIVHKPYYQGDSFDSTLNIIITSYDSIQNRMTGTFSSSTTPNGTFDVRFREIIARKK